MSALLIYKQRTLKPNHPQTTPKNISHIEYIATRPGVLKNDLTKCGLFGSIDGLQNQNSIDLSLATKRVKEISKEKRNMFRSVISFTDEQAAELGLNSLADWQEYIKKQMPIIARENGIKLENLEWVAAIHQKDGHPHAHIAFWDKEQQVQVQFVPAKRIAVTRRKLIDNTYPQQHAEKIATQELAKKELHFNFKEKTTDLSDSYLMTALGTYRLKCLLNNNHKLFSQFINLRNEIREYKGSLMFKYLPPELKRDVVSFLRKLITSDEKLKLYFNNYITARVDYNKLYTLSDERLKEITAREIATAEKQLANNLLRAIKDLNYNLDSLKSQGEQLGESDKLELTATSLLGIFADLSKTTKSPKISNHSAAVGGDLSLAARKEKAKEAKDRGLGVER